MALAENPLKKRNLGRKENAASVRSPEIASTLAGIYATRLSNPGELARAQDFLDLGLMPPLMQRDDAQHLQHVVVPQQRMPVPHTPIIEPRILLEHRCG